MVAIVDYGVGNLFSLKSSLAAVGADAIVTGEPSLLRSADRIILPGVGAFRDAADKLRSLGLDKVIKELAAEGKPIMGICLGMQMLFEKSYEYGEYEGLGLIPGRVVPLGNVILPELMVPHIGWNALITDKKSDPLWKYINEGDCVYFVHSYYASDCDDYVIAHAEYSAPITAAVRNENVCGCQFHPEKSGDVGLNILRAFCEI